MNYTAALICLISIAIISEGRHISNQDFDTVHHLQANEGYRMKRSLPDPSRNTFPQFVNVFQHTALKTFGCGGCGGCGCRSCGGCAAKKRAAAALLKAMKRARSRQRSAVSQKNRNSIVKEGGMASVGGGGGGASRGGGGGISRGGGGGISRGGGGSISRGGGTGGSGGGYAGGTAGSGSMSRTGSGSKSGSGSSSAGGSSSSGVVININNYGTSSGHHGQSGQDVHAKAENYSAGSANAGTDIHIGGKNDDGNFRSVMSRKQKHGVNAKQHSQTNVVNKG